MLEGVAVDVGLCIGGCLALASYEARSSRRQRLCQVHSCLPQQRSCMPDRDAYEVGRAPFLPELVQEWLVFSRFVG